MADHGKKDLAEAILVVLARNHLVWDQTEDLLVEGASQLECHQGGLLILVADHGKKDLDEAILVVLASHLVWDQTVDLLVEGAYQLECHQVGLLIGHADRWDVGQCGGGEIRGEGQQDGGPHGQGLVGGHGGL